MTVIRRLFYLTAAISAFSGCSSLRDGAGHIVELNGKFSEISFRMPLNLLSKPPLLPDRSWKTGEYFEFEAGTSTASITVRVRYELKKYAYFENVADDQRLADQLAILERNFIDPKGRVVEHFNLRDESIPIFTFTNVGGEYLAASVPLSGSYSATIYLMSDDAYQNMELLQAMKVILETFDVAVR